METTVRVSLLGSLEVRDSDRVTPISGVKLQSLLALLALSTPHVVPDGRLVEELWGDAQPAKPANALQALVSHLRRLLGPNVVSRQSSGYALRLDPDEIDAIRFERFVQQAGAAAACGDPRSAADGYVAALALVRGPPLGDLRDAWFARDATARLEELRLAAHEGLADCELALGRHADTVRRLGELIADQPLRERFRAQLIIALYRCGRQADALRAYRDARDYLLEELGLEPGPELRSLERSVLAHDPMLAAPSVLTTSFPVRPALPDSLTSFVGRQAEFVVLQRAVDEARLISIVGTGGVGKTRLAVEFARHLPEGSEVWFIELAPVVNAANVAEALARGLGADERSSAKGQPPPHPERRAADRLGDRPALMILDNCEHVSTAVASCVLGLLNGCPGLRIIVTSREPLGVDGEHQVTLGPLDDTSSAELFTERARTVQPHFGADGSADDELAELCRHLDGLPLAIELAAARTKTLPVPEIATRLRHRFQLLRRPASAGDVPPRHEGLEAAIDWSYELLFESDRRMFRRMAVFNGGATISAAERLCGEDAFEVGSRLVDRSLLVADASRRIARFDMLESLRDYGLDRLAESGELAEVRAEHLRWCIELVERVDIEARGRDQLDWLARLDDEHDNVRAALAYAIAHDPAGALRLAGAAILPWWFRGRRQETRRWVEDALAADVGEAPALRARVLAYSGLVAELAPSDIDHREDMSASLAIAEQRQRDAIAIAAGDDDEEEDDDETVTAFYRVLLLNTLVRQASTGERVDDDEFDRLVEVSTEVLDRVGDDFGSCLVRVIDGLYALTLGDAPRAAAAVDAALPHARRSGDRFSASRIEYVRGMLDDVAGDPASAYRRIELSLKQLDELGIQQAVTAQARILGPLADRLGEPQLASQWRSFVRDRGGGWSHYDGSVLAVAHNHEGLDARQAGDCDRAAEAHRSALEWFASAGLPSGVAFSESCLGFLANARGDRLDATRHHAAAVAAARGLTDPSALALALEGCAGIAPDPTGAATLLGAAQRLRTSTTNPTTSSKTVTTNPTHRHDVDRIAAAARHRLGDDRFGDAVAAGAALDRSAAVAIAITVAGSTPESGSTGAQSGSDKPGQGERPLLMWASSPRATSP